MNSVDVTMEGSEDDFTQSAPQKSACERALETQEILEDILSRLPPKVILSVRQVSYRWNDTITRSRGIQQALYLETRKMTYVYIAPPQPDFNFAALYRSFNPRHFDGVTLGNSAIIRPAIINPFLEKTGDNLFILLIELSDHMRKHINCRDAPWRRMFLTQPPDVQATLVVRDQSGSRHAIFDVREPNGITLGSLVSFVTSRPFYFRPDFTLELHRGRHKLGARNATRYVTSAEDLMVHKVLPGRFIKKQM